MEPNLKYRKAFLIIGYGVLLQFFIRPLYEFVTIPERQIKAYLCYKAFIFLAFIGFIFCVHTSRLIKHWVVMFYANAFVLILVGQYFSPGYHFPVIQLMFICAIVFEGFPLVSSILTGAFLIEYFLHPFYKTSFPDFPSYHSFIIGSIVSSWIISVALERYVNRVKHKQGLLDKKLRYKGIKTELFLHDLKNKLQPLVSLYPHQEDFREIVRTIQGFNSFHESGEILFKEVVMETKKKFNIIGECTIVGSDDFFIDQMDLQTILGNLMINSQKVSQERGIYLHMILKNDNSGFYYEDNAGGMTDEQHVFFTQKEFKPYPGHEKNGLGLLLIKKLVEHHEGKFSIKKIPGGTRFEIDY